MAQPINNIQVSGVTYGSTVNGPGIRTVLHTQGCTIGCPGCFNKHTWDLSGGTSVDTYSLAENILSGSDSSNGLTLSGGEPMQQITALRLLIKTIRSWRPETNVLMFSGLDRKTLDLVEGLNNLSQHIDAIIAGPYENGQKSSGLIASDNQELIILTNRFKESDFTEERSIEVLCEGADVTITGFPTKEERRSLLRELK